MRFPVRPAAVLAVTLALAGCSRGAPPATGGATAETSATVAEQGVRGDASLVPASPAELARLVHAGGAPVTLVNVWASWCNPCREEMPELLEVARRHPDVRLLLVSADFDDQRAAAASFLADQGVRGTTYVKTGADQAFIDTFDRRWTGSLPATFVYDAAGRQVAFWEGKADAARFEAAIAKARTPKPQ